MKRWKFILLIAVVGCAVCWFCQPADARIFGRRKECPECELRLEQQANPQTTVSVPTGNTRRGDYNAKGGYKGVVPQSYFDSYFAAEGTAAASVPPPAVSKEPEALAVDTALANVNRAEAALSSAKKDLEAAIEAKKQAAIARSEAAKKEMKRITKLHDAQIEKLRELLVSLEPTPAE